MCFCHVDKKLEPNLWGLSFSHGFSRRNILAKVLRAGRGTNRTLHTVSGVPSIPMEGLITQRPISSTSSQLIRNLPLPSLLACAWLLLCIERVISYHYESNLNECWSLSSKCQLVKCKTAIMYLLSMLRWIPRTLVEYCIYTHPAWSDLRNHQIGILVPWFVI